MASYGVIWGRRNARSLTESGYKDFEADLWYGVVAPSLSRIDSSFRLVGRSGVWIRMTETADEARKCTSQSNVV